MRISWVEPRILAAGGIPLSKTDVDDLHQQGIRAILTLTELPLTHQREITSALLTQSDITTFHFPIVDQFPPEAEKVAEAVAFIDRMKGENRPVYVHCHAGIGRTGTILHAYYLSHGFSMEAAKEKVKAGKFTSQFFMLSETQQAFLEAFAAKLTSG